MVNVSETLSLLLVGILWGCTNPFMRKGFIETKSTKQQQPGQDDGLKSFILNKLVLLVNIKVWLPYLLNQCGSLLYYKTLASSNLTLSVPICNALSLVFSCITSVLLGERMNQPRRAVFGVILVLLGVGVCMYSNEIDEIVRDHLLPDADIIIKEQKINEYSQHFEEGEVIGEMRVDSVEDVELEL